MENEFKVAVTGHRPNKLGGYDWNSPKRVWVREKLKDKIIQIKPEVAISGMALGVDQEYAFLCHQMGIPFIAAIPFEGQEKAWPKSSQDFYTYLLGVAKEVVIVSKGGYAAYKMQVRNEWMVDNCQTLIAVWDGTAGGTGNCVEYAEKIGRQIERINPAEFYQEK